MLLPSLAAHLNFVSLKKNPSGLIRAVYTLLGVGHPLVCSQPIGDHILKKTDLPPPLPQENPPNLDNFSLRGLGAPSPSSTETLIYLILGSSLTTACSSVTLLHVSRPQPL